MAERARHITWEDPMASAADAATLSGLQFLRAIASGEIPQPPISHLLSMRLAEAGEGWATFVMDPDESMYNPIGSVHGGAIAAMCDSAASCAVHSMLPAGVRYTTSEVSVNYLRPVLADTGRLICRGEAIHVGRRLGTASARLEDENGRLYAHGTVTCFIIRPETG